MNRIDCGILNEKCLNRILKEVRNSSALKIIVAHVLKVGKEMSLVLEFRNENEKNFWDHRSGELVEDLKRLWRKK